MLERLAQRLGDRRGPDAEDRWPVDHLEGLRYDERRELAGREGRIAVGQGVELQKSPKGAVGNPHDRRAHARSGSDRTHQVDIGDPFLARNVVNLPGTRSLEASGDDVAKVAG